MAYTLTIGSTGLDVKKMQYYLNEILAKPTYQRMTEDGVFGQKTQFAVGLFQYLYGLPTDGIIGNSTWNRIVTEFKALSNPTPERNKSTRTISVGSVGLAVQKFQEYMNQLVVPSPQLVVDGNFGQRTKQAIQTFQARNGLTADGVIGNATWDKTIQLL